MRFVCSAVDNPAKNPALRKRIRVAVWKTEHYAESSSWPAARSDVCRHLQRTETRFVFVFEFDSQACCENHAGVGAYPLQLCLPTNVWICAPTNTRACVTNTRESETNTRAFAMNTCAISARLRCVNRVWGLTKRRRVPPVASNYC